MRLAHARAELTLRSSRVTQHRRAVLPRHKPTSPPIISLSLGNLAWFWSVQVGARFMRARFMRERKIRGTRPLQHFAFSPPEEERSERAKNDYQHDKRNQERQRPSFMSYDRCSGSCSRCAGSL